MFSHRTLMTVVVMAAILARCHSPTTTTVKSAAQYRDEAVRAAAAAKELAEKRQFNEADNLFQQAKQAAEQAQSRAAAEESQEASQAAQQAQHQVSSLQQLLAQERAASNAAEAANNSTVAAADQMTGQDLYLRDAIEGVAKDVTCKWLYVQVVEQRRITWDELRGFIVEAAAKNAVPQGKAAELRGRAEDFNKLMAEVQRQREAQQADPTRFREHFCGVATG